MAHAMVKALPSTPWLRGIRSPELACSSEEDDTTPTPSLRHCARYGRCPRGRATWRRWREGGCLLLSAWAFDLGHLPAVVSPGGASSLSTALSARCPAWRQPSAPRSAVVQRRITNSQRELLDMPAYELRDLCAQRKLGTYGGKQELVLRLLTEGGNGEPADGDQASDGKGPMARFMRDLKRRPPGEAIDASALEEIFQIQRPQPGEIVKGRITHIREFGAFVQIEDTGWTGLIHVSEVCEHYVDNIEEVCKVGTEVEAMVVASGSERLDRLSLSLRRMPEKNEDERLSAEEKMRAGRRDPVAEVFRRLEVRVFAIEMVLISLGHGKLLRAAQDAARFGHYDALQPEMSRPPVVPITTISEMRAKERGAATREQIKIDEILAEAARDAY